MESTANKKNLELRVLAVLLLLWQSIGRW